MSIGIATLGMFHPPSEFIGGGGGAVKLIEAEKKKPRIHVLKITSSNNTTSESLDNLIKINSVKLKEE